MTANYSVDTLKQKLDKLSHTQESIQMTCFWLNFHKKHLKESVQIWAEELAKQIPQRKLFFLYLANDLIQTAKKKQTGFDTAFQLVLPTCFEESFKFVHEEVKQKVGKILQVWKERRIYPEDFLMKLSNSIGLDSQFKSTENRSENLIRKAVDLSPPQVQRIMQIVASLNQLSRSKESCSQKVSMIPDSLLQIDNLDSQPYSDLDQKNTEIQSCIQQIGVLEQILDSEFKAKKDLMDQLEQFLETTKKEIVENQLIQEQLRDKKKELTNAFERFSSKLLAPQVSATTGVHKATLDRLFK